MRVKYVSACSFRLCSNGKGMSGTEESCVAISSYKTELLRDVCTKTARYEGVSCSSLGVRRVGD